MRDLGYHVKTELERLIGPVCRKGPGVVCPLAAVCQRGGAQATVEVPLGKQGLPDHAARGRET